MELIDKSAVVAEIEKRLHTNGAFDEVGDEAWTEDVGMCNAYKSILSFLDTLEVKEVDLVKEYDGNFSNDPVYSKLVNRNAGIGIAKHFFNLGLRTQKEGFKKDCETEYPNFDEAQSTPITK